MRRGSEGLDGFVDSGCTLRGELEFTSAFRLEGRVEGTIRSSAELVIGESGVVEGEIAVARCLVAGTVTGKITATERVTLHAGARVRADIVAPAVVIEEGAVLKGHVAMKSRDDGSPATSPRETP